MAIRSRHSVGPKYQVYVQGFPTIKRLCATRSIAQAQPSTAPGYQRDPELQAALHDLLDETVGQGRTRLPNSEVKQHLERLEEVGRKLGLNRVNPDWNDGAFRGTLTTMMSGVTREHECSMARLTFGRVQPANLMLQIGAVPATAAGVAEFPEQLKGPLAEVAEAPDRGYSTITYFTIQDAGVVGRIAVKGVYSVDEEDPSKLNISFVGFTVEPALRDEKSLARWREALAEHNPNMTAAGVIECKMDTPLKSHLRYLVMEPDFHAAIGGSGGFTCMVRMKGQPA